MVQIDEDTLLKLNAAGLMVWGAGWIGAPEAMNANTFAGMLGASGKGLADHFGPPIIAYGASTYIARNAGPKVKKDLLKVLGLRWAACTAITAAHMMNGTEKQTSINVIGAVGSAVIAGLSLYVGFRD